VFKQMLIPSQGDFGGGAGDTLLALILSEPDMPYSVLVVDEETHRPIVGIEYCIDPVTRAGEEAIVKAALTLASYIVEHNILN
jgi:hypothetical protein